LNIGDITNLYNYFLIVNKDKILYIKEKRPTVYDLFLLNFVTNEEHALELNSYLSNQSAIWINNYILCFQLFDPTIYIYDCTSNKKIHQISPKYKNYYIRSSENKIIIIPADYKFYTIEIYDKNIPFISFICEIDLKDLINFTYADFDIFFKFFSSSSSDELFISYYTNIGIIKTIKFDLNTFTLELIKEFDNDIKNINLQVYLPNTLQLW